MLWFSPERCGNSSKDPKKSGEVRESGGSFYHYGLGKGIENYRPIKIVKITVSKSSSTWLVFLCSKATIKNYGKYWDSPEDKRDPSPLASGVDWGKPSSANMHLRLSLSRDLRFCLRWARLFITSLKLLWDSARLEWISRDGLKRYSRPRWLHCCNKLSFSINLLSFPNRVWAQPLFCHLLSLIMG